MTYACEIWGNDFDCKSQKVVTLQKRAIRLIAKSSHLSNSEPLFEQLRCLKFQNLAQFKIQLQFWIFAKLNLQFFWALIKLKSTLDLLVCKICLQNVTIVTIPDPVWRAIFILNSVVQKRDLLILVILVWDCGIIWMKISVLQEVLTYLRKTLKICSLIPIPINAFCIYWLICIIYPIRERHKSLNYNMLIYSQYFLNVIVTVPYSYLCRFTLPN